MFEFDFLRSLVGLNGPRYLGTPSSGPTAQQQALQTEQATTNANLNLEENEQRKVILNAMQGTRVFRGSALSRAVASNTAGTVAPVAPAGASGQQTNAPLRSPGAGTSLLDVAGGTGIPGLAGGSVSPEVAAGRSAGGAGRGGAGGGNR